MSENIIKKIRSLVLDWDRSDVESFEYSNSNVFTLSEENASAVTDVTINGNELQTGESYSFVPLTNKLTITSVNLSVDDLILVTYSYTKYSDTELKRYISSACVKISMNYKDFDYDFSNDYFVFTPNSREEDLIADIASILLTCNLSSYSNGQISYKKPITKSKDEQIRATISHFKTKNGTTDTLDWTDRSL